MKAPVYGEFIPDNKAKIESGLIESAFVDKDGKVTHLQYIIEDWKTVGVRSMSFESEDIYRRDMKIISNRLKHGTNT